MSCAGPDLVLVGALVVLAAMVIFAAIMLWRCGDYAQGLERKVKALEAKP